MLLRSATRQSAQPPSSFSSPVECPPSSSSTSRSLPPSSSPLSDRRVALVAPASFLLTCAQVSHLRRAALTHAHSDTTQTLEHALQSITGHHLTLQAQELTASILSVWVRLPTRLQKVASRSVLSKHALIGENEQVVRIWGQRGTLQLAKREDWPAISAAVRERVRSMAQSGVRKHGTEAMQFLNDVETHFVRRLNDGSGFNSADLDSFVSRVIPPAVAALGDVRRTVKRSVPVLVTVDGRGERITSDDIRRVTIVPRKHGEWEHVPELDGLVRCALRYFDVYGPATEQDFRYWMGIKASISKCAVNACIDSGEIRVVQTVSGEMMLHKRRFTDIERIHNGPSKAQRRVWLLGRFDALLLAHKDKSWIVNERWRRSVWSLYSDVAPTVLLDGRICGTWRRDGVDLIRVTLFEGLGRGVVGEDILSEICNIGKQMLSQFWGVDGGVVVQVGGRQVMSVDRGSQVTWDDEVGRGRRSKRARRR